jgi:colanic acid biosynthesis glycosyl transferase WcaI
VSSALVLTQYYRPVPNFVSADVAALLRRHGSVTVVTAHPSYPQGRFYPGTRWWQPERKVEEGVVVWRLPMIPDQSQSVLRRTVSYVSFLLVALVWAPFVGGRPRVVWVYQTPFTTAIAALWFKLVWGSRLVYTCADLWPESLSAADVTRSGGLMRVLFAYRRWSNRWADAIICATRGTLARFADEGIPPAKLHHVPVWVDGTDASAGGVCANYNGKETRSIVYAGNLGPAQQLDTVIRAAAILNGSEPGLTFDLYGTGSAEAGLRNLADSLGAGNVRFHGRVIPETAFDASRCAVAQIVSLRPAPLFRMTVPSKLAFCFAASAPLLYGLEGEAAEIAAGSGGGVPFTPGCPDSLVAAVRDLLARPAEERRRMRAALRACFEHRFSREKLLARYEEILT